MLFRGVRKLPVAATVLLLATTSIAQDADPATIPWAYSNYFGTGWYEIGDNRDAFILRYVYRQTLREASLDEQQRTTGLELRVPVTAGLNHFPLDDLAGSINPDNLANISVTPGLYLDVPVSERWMLRPFASIGWGSVLGGDGAAWTWWGGVSSRYLLHDGTARLALINSASFVGYTPDDGPSERFFPLTTALELSHGMASLAGGEDELRLHWHAAFTHYHDDLELGRAEGGAETVSEQWEAGLAFSRRERPIRLLWLSFERLGLAYRFNSSQDLQGVALVFRSLFDQ